MRFSNDLLTMSFWRSRRRRLRDFSCIPWFPPAFERRTRPETRTKKPPMYKVILLNDDYTPMEFVVEILKVVFHKQHAEATRIMLHVHQNGMGVAGVFPYEIAETKVRTVEELARQSEFPLKCVMEKA